MQGRFAQSPSKDKSQQNSPRKPGVAVCSKIRGGDTHGSAPLCPGYLQPRVAFSSEALLPNKSCLFASGVVFPPHLPSGRRIRCLPHPQASRCSQPPENPQHWGQGTHHVVDHPLVPPAHSPSVVGSAFFASARCWWGSGTILSSVHSSAVLSLGAGGALPSLASALLSLWGSKRHHHRTPRPASPPLVHRRQAVVLQSPQSRSSSLLILSFAQRRQQLL